MPKKMEIQLGEVYGYLQVIEDAGLKKVGKQGINRRFIIAKCLNCDSKPKQYCMADLRSGNTKSCGCFNIEKIKEHSTTHGLSSTRQYKTWFDIKERCLNEKNHKYEYYGARGITVCEKWLTFEGFWEDMSEGYSDDLQIDRVDVNGEYCKENCRWTTRSENAYNQRIKKSNTSGKSGVSFNKKLNKWAAYITCNTVRKFLGCFKTFEEAVIAREKAEIEYFGYNKE